MTSSESLARSFGKEADAYDAARPGYPVEALEWLVPSTARTVLDLGAGTGKFSRLLVDAGFETIAVEPSAEMLARLRVSLPSVDTRVGAAERIPLDDDSVDAVVVAQAWHWVDARAAVPEVARVLRPGGTLGLVWNVQDASPDWVAALAAITGNRPSSGFDTVAVAAEPFGPMDSTIIRWSLTVDRDRIRALISSWSDIITAPQQRRKEIFAAVDELLNTHPDLLGRDEFELPYFTHCYRTRLSA